MANINMTRSRLKFKLQDITLSLAVTFSTKPVHWLSTIIDFFVSIYKNTSSNFFKFILTLYLRPFFKLRYFLYQIIFLSQQKRLLLLHRQSIALHGEKYLKNFGNSVVSLNFSIERAYTLCNFVCSLSGDIK